MKFNSQEMRLRRERILLHAGFVLTGVMTTLMGPLLPVLSGRWSLNDAQAGNLFSSQFLGSMVGVGLSGVIASRRGFHVPIALGYGLIGWAAFNLTGGSWSMGLAWFFCNGVGLGLVIPSTNLLVAEHDPLRSSATLNLLNFSWGIGATLCPFVVAHFVRSDSSATLLFGLAAAAASFTVIFSFLGESGGHRAASIPGHSSGRFRGWGLIPVLGALFFLYVGVESSIGGWIASYTRRIGISEGPFWILSPSLFWGALLAGRATAPLALRIVTDVKIARGGLALALCGIALLLSAKTTSAIGLGAILAGFGLAPIYPITIARFSNGVGSNSPRIGGMMFALAGLGGATLPWLVGLVSSRFANLKTGLLVPLVGNAAMLALYLAGQRETRDAP